MTPTVNERSEEGKGVYLFFFAILEGEREGKKKGRWSEKRKKGGEASSSDALWRKPEGVRGKKERSSLCLPFVEGKNPAGLFFSFSFLLGFISNDGDFSSEGKRKGEGREKWRRPFADVMG